MGEMKPLTKISGGFFVVAVAMVQVAMMAVSQVRESLLFQGKH
jgi:hypothetical protein